MTSNQGPSWTKLMAFCSMFVLPALGVAYALIVGITKINDKIDHMQTRQQEQSSDIKDMRNDLNALKIVVDTIKQSQRDDRKEMQYRFMLQETKH